MARRKISFDRDPPLLPLVELARQRGLTVAMDSSAIGLVGDSAAELKNYQAEFWGDLDGRAVGNAADLLDVWRHVVVAKNRIWLLKDALERRLPHRENVCAELARAACQLAEAALLMHTSRHDWYVYPGLGGCRTALECAAKAFFVATGTSDEAQRWLRWYRQPKSKRRQLEIKMAECLEVFVPFVEERTPVASRAHFSVQRVYDWLCDYVHFDARAARRPPTHEDEYAALAFVAWCSAIVAEHIMGCDEFARFPNRMPTDLPWLRPRRTT